MNLCLLVDFVHQKCSNYALTNLLFGLCRSMWVIDLLVTIPSPYPGTPAHPFTPKLLRAREHTPIPHSFIVFTLDSHLNLLKSLGVCHSVSQPYFERVWGWDSHSRNGSLGALWDFWKFRVWLKGSKSLALGRPLYHWKAIEM